MPTLDQLFHQAANAHGIQAKDFSQPSRHFINANGLRFHYVDWGGSGVPILFLHGGNQTARTWDLVCVQLRDRYHCYALDQRNHGESDKVAEGPSASAEQREDIRGVVEALGLPKFVLVGMSLGGFNTMAYASKYPERLRAVVIVDVSPTVLPQGARRIAEFTRRSEFASFEEAVAYSLKSNPRRTADHLRYSLTFALGQRPDGVWTWKHQRPFRGAQSGGAAGPPAAQQPTQPAQPPPNGLGDRAALWQEVTKIPCPTLIVRGGNSEIMSVENAERLARAIPRATLVTVPGATHNVQGDDPKQLTVELARFLKTVV